MAVRPTSRPKRRQRYAQTNFTTGELDPLMRMRSDLKTYFRGARDLRNTQLLVQGGVKRRDGTVFRQDLLVDTYLHEFSFTEGQDYGLGFQNTKLVIFDIDGSIVQTLTGCPWNATQMKEMTIATSADTIIICHKDFAQYRVLRTSATTFTAADFSFDTHSSGNPVYQPYFKFVSNAITMTPSGTSGSINLTCSVDHFVAADVGSLYRYKSKEILINTITSATVAACTVKETLASTTADEDWDEQTFSTRRGFPRAVAFHAQRLLFSGSTDRPDGFWGSQTSAFFNFDVGSAEDNEAIDVTIAADDISEVRHLVSSRNIQVFTNGGEMYVPTSAGTPLTPSNIQFLTQTPYGVTQGVAPVKFDGATIFLQSSGAVIREFIFNDIEQAHTSDAISPASNHLLGTVIDSAVLLGTASTPEQYAFFVNDDGTVAVFHSVRNEQLAGWVPWDIGTDKYLSITQVGSKLFAVTQRTIAGTTVYWLEEFDPDVTLDAVTKYDTSTELSTNGTFASDTGWTKGTGWSIAGGVANCNGDQTADSDLEQAITAYTNGVFRVTFTLSNVTAGNITPRVVDGVGTAESVNGTFQHDIIAFTGVNLQFRASSDFKGDISNVTVTEVNVTFTVSHMKNSIAVRGTTNTSRQFLGDVTTDTDGIVTFSVAVDNAHIGLGYSVRIETNPPDAVPGSGSLIGLKKKIGKTVVSIYETRSIAVNGAELILSDVDDDFSAVPELVTGDFTFYLRGWAIDPTVVITQSQPLKMTLRGLFMEFMA